MNVSGTKEVLVERVKKQVCGVHTPDELQKAKEEVESMRQIIERQKREIQLLKTNENTQSSSHSNTPSPLPSHAVAIKKGFEQYGLKLNRRSVYL